MTVFLGVSERRWPELGYFPAALLAPNAWKQLGETPAFSKFMGNAIYFMIKLHQGNAAFCIRQFSSSNCYPGGLFSSLNTQPIYNTDGSSV